MRYLVTAIIALISVGLIAVSEYYNDSPKNDHYLEVSFGVVAFYFFLIYVLLLGLYDIFRGIRNLFKRIVSAQKT